MKPNPATVAFQDAGTIVKSLSKSTGLNPTEKAALEFVTTNGNILAQLSVNTELAYWDMFTLGGVDLSTRRKYERQTSFDDRLKGLQQRFGSAASSAEAAYIDFKNNAALAKEIAGIYKKRNQIKNPFLRRQVEVAQIIFSESGIDPKLEKQISANETQLQQMYGEFRAQVNGKSVESQAIEELLQKSRGNQGAKDAVKLVKAALAAGNHQLNGSGPTIAELHLETVKMRNKFARKATGDSSTNYYSYSLGRQNISEDQLVKLREEVKCELKPAYDRLRARMDAAAAKRYGISESDARLPWFQGGVKQLGIIQDVMNFNLDKHFRGMDPRPLIKETARRIGFNADEIIDQSDLFPRPGKNPHWYMFPMQAPYGIRTFGNIDPSFKKMMGRTFEIQFHEAIGHGGGNSFVNPELPPILRSLDTITTESDAMMMEDLMYNKYWLKEIAKFDDNTIDAFLSDGKQFNLASELCTFFKNYLLVPDFEREVYRLSDRQLTLENVNKLWTEKTEEYLGITIPKDRNNPDWAYLIHFATAPVYYQSYFLGQLARAQNHAHLNEINGNRGIFDGGTGEFWARYRGVGEAYQWDELVQYQTGQALGVDALKSEFEKLEI